MVQYLTRGFIAELAIADVIKRHFQKLRYGKLYKNFHLSVTNDHPFAHLVIHQDSSNVADMFPSIVVTTQSDSKSPEMTNVPPQISAVGLNEEDFEKIKLEKRVKTYIDDETGIERNVKKNGELVYETLPGMIEPCDESILAELKEIAKNKTVYGISYTNRRHDRISIEIWAENAQLKNEIYEHLRVLFETCFVEIFQKTYKKVNPVIFDTSVNGERSNNFNFDFDVPLYGANITLEIEYSTNQIVIDTDITDVKNLIVEVTNHVKELKQEHGNRNEQL